MGMSDVRATRYLLEVVALGSASCLLADWHEQVLKKLNKKIEGDEPKR